MVRKCTSAETVMVRGKSSPWVTSKADLVHCLGLRYRLGRGLGSFFRVLVLGPACVLVTSPGHGPGPEAGPRAGLAPSSGVGCWVLGPGFWVLDLVRWVLGLVLCIFCLGCWLWSWSRPRPWPQRWPCPLSWPGAGLGLAPGRNPGLLSWSCSLSWPPIENQ